MVQLYVSGSTPNLLRGILLTDRRKGKVSVKLEFREHTITGGRIKFEPLKWEYSIKSRYGRWFCAFRDRDLLLDPSAALRKLRTVPTREDYPHVRDKSKRYGHKIAGPYPPSYPILKSGHVVHATETYNSQLPWPPYTTPYTVLSGTDYNSLYVTRTSVRTPGFGGQSRNELPVNPFSSTIVKTEDGQQVWLVDAIVRPGWAGFPWYSHQWYITSPVINSLLPPPLTHDTTAFNKSMNKVLERSQQEITGNLLQDVGQFGQTVRLITNTSARLVGSARALKKFQFAKALDYLWHARHARRVRKQPKSFKNSLLSNTKTLAENWLELQYAWKPLLRDVQAAMESLSQYLEKDSTVKEVRGAGRTESKVIKPIIGSYGQTIGELTIKTVTISKIGLRYRVSDHAKAFAAQLGFTNPINFLWEVIPFSFVADWFYPIGPYLEKLTAFQGLEFKDGYQTYFTKQTISADINYDAEVQSAGGRYRHAGSYRREWIKVDRIVLTDFPDAKVPKLKSPVSKTHALNSLALLVAVFGGRFRK